MDTWLNVCNTYNKAVEVCCENDKNDKYGKCTIDHEDLQVLYDGLLSSYKDYKKNDRGDIISEGKEGYKYTVNPFTNEKVPVYSEKEEELLKELYEAEDHILELEDWLETEKDSTLRSDLRRDLDHYYKTYDEIQDDIDKLRNEGDWKEVREKQKKIAKEKESKRKAQVKKKADKKKKEEAKKKKKEAERSKIIKDMPDDFKEAMEDLF